MHNNLARNPVPDLCAHRTFQLSCIRSSGRSALRLARALQLTIGEHTMGARQIGVPSFVIFLLFVRSSLPFNCFAQRSSALALQHLVIQAAIRDEEPSASPRRAYGPYPASGSPLPPMMSSSVRFRLRRGRKGSFVLRLVFDQPPGSSENSASPLKPRRVLEIRPRINAVGCCDLQGPSSGDPLRSHEPVYRHPPVVDRCARRPWQAVGIHGPAAAYDAAGCCRRTDG